MPAMILGIPAAVFASLAGTAINTGLGLGMSGSARNEANRRRIDAKSSAEKEVRNTIKTLTSSNYIKNLGIEKDIIRKNLETAIAQQRNLRLGTTDQTFAQSGVSQLQKNLNNILDQATAAESRQMQNIAFKAAARDQEIADSIAGIQAGVANQKFKEAADYAAQEAGYRQQQGQILAKGIGSMATAALPTAIGGLEAKALEKDLGSATGSVGTKTYFSDQLKDMGTKDGLATITNPSLQTAIAGNATLGEQLSNIAATGDNEAVTKFLMENLDQQSLQNIIQDIPSTMNMEDIFADVNEDILKASGISGGETYGLLGQGQVNPFQY